MVLLGDMRLDGAAAFVTGARRGLGRAARAAVDEAALAPGRLDIAVNAAWVCPRVPPLETPDGVVRRIFEVNVFGTLAVCQAAVAPGQFGTGMGRPLLDEPELLGEFLERVPLRRVARPGEKGALMVYLCARASAFMTGSVIVLDGGLSLP